MRRFIVPVIAGLIVLVVGAEAAAIPPKINYQGKLVDGSGTPLAGTHDAVFRLYDAPVLGTMLWSDSATVASDAGGIFSVVLGGDHPMVTGLGDSCWLEIEIDGEILVPRREMVSVPYALRAAAADSLGGLAAEAFAAADHTHDERYSAKTQLETPGSINQTGNPVDWTKLKGVPAGLADGVDNVGPGDGYSLDAADGSPTDVVYVDNAGHVGVGTKTPAVDLDVAGTLRVSSGATTPFEVKGTGSTYAKVEAGAGASAGLVLRNSSREWNLVDGVGGQDKLSFYDATSLKHRLMIDGATGRIGIGATNPESDLHIYRYAGDEVAIRLDNRHTGPFSTEAIYFVDENLASAGLAAYDDDHGFGEALRLFNVRPHGYIALSTLGRISLSAGGLEQVRLTSDGSLGVGTTDPKAKLEVNGLARIIGTDGFSWPSAGEGIELAYNPGINRGYIQVYNRSTPGWGDLYLGDGKVGIGGGSLDKTGKLNVQVAGGSCIIAENTGGNCSAEIAGASGFGLLAKSTGNAVYAWNTSSDCYTYLGGLEYGLFAMGKTTHAYLGHGSNAGDFIGDVYVYGNIYKSGGGFRIDHPLYPENKYLNHSFVESPDMMDIYNGNIVLGEGGEAWVEMPQWFEVLNRDFRYQLTCIGRFAPVYVAETISGNRFKIAGGEPGQEVSWQVTGIRHDPYANAHRIPVEEDKASADRGKYLSPDAYDKPASAGIGYLARPGEGQ
jgi:hypothetical protein